jgi:hypothetical protein
MTKRSESPILSQIETREPQRRVVLLGASNLSIMFPTVVETARAMFAQPLEMFVAKGFGRSYGQQSKFFGKKFLGILHCGLWPALERAKPLPTVAILADIGNDLAYEAPVEQIVDWIQKTLDRLQASDAKVVVNNIPLASLRMVGAARFHFFREMLFPSCRLSRRELLWRAERLSEALERLAQERKTPVFSGEKAWYGIDPIHPRPRAAGEIWRRMLNGWDPTETDVQLVRPSASTRVRLHRLRPESWVQFGIQGGLIQPSARLADGTTIALY